MIITAIQVRKDLWLCPCNQFKVPDKTKCTPFLWWLNLLLSRHRYLFRKIASEKVPGSPLFLNRYPKGPSLETQFERIFRSPTEIGVGIPLEIKGYQKFSEIPYLQTSPKKIYESQLCFVLHTGMIPLEPGENGEKMPIAHTVFFSVTKFH